MTVFGRFGGTQFCHTAAIAVVLRFLTSPVVHHLCLCSPELYIRRSRRLMSWDAPVLDPKGQDGERRHRGHGTVETRIVVGPVGSQFPVLPGRKLSWIVRVQFRSPWAIK